MLSENERRSASLALADAERRREAIAPLSATWPHIEASDAYEIQLLGVETRLRDGRTVRGHKVGLTSRAMQDALGVHQPDYGHLLDDMFVVDGGTLSAADFCAPRIEPEVAFVLGAPLRGPGVNAADVLRATAFVMPALELIDSRIADWRITITDTIADNASSARVVLGGIATRPDALDLRTIGCVLRRRGQVVETGASGAALGNPVAAVAWLANTLASAGSTLDAGEVVLPGSCTRAVEIVAGDTIRADFDALGHVSVTLA